MGHAKSGTSIWKKRQWQRKAQEERAECGHVWEWDPADRMMRCYKCGGVRLPTDVDKVGPSHAQDARRDNAADTGLIIRLEGGDTDF